MKPIRLQELFAKLRIPTSSDVWVQGAAIDSRCVKPGDLFFALKGARVDGHDFLGEVASRGAVAAVVHPHYTGSLYGMASVRCEHPEEILQQLAQVRLQEYKTRILAITGSLGKTTTKEFAKTLLSTSFRLFASPKNYNSQLSMPLNILAMDGDEELLILEMGMTEPGHIARLTKIAPPHVALITTVSMMHIDAFPEGLAGIAQEKAAIFSQEQTELGWYLHEAPHAEILRKTGHGIKKTYSLTSPEADLFLHRQGEEFWIHELGGRTTHHRHVFPMDIYDGHLLGAWALARTMGMDPEVLGGMLPFLQVPSMRFERIQRNGITFFNDAYNANPESMVAAFRNLPRPSRFGRRVGILAEMVTLGNYSEQGHRDVASRALEYLDILLCVGPHTHAMKSIWDQHGKPCYWFASAEELQSVVADYIREEDVVLLKGSRRHALEQVLHSVWPG